MKDRQSNPRMVLLPMISVLFVLALGSAWGQDNAESSRVNFYVEPILQKGLGGTSYDLSATGVASRLEFPQWALEAGGVLGVSGSKGEEREWFVEAAAAHSTFNVPGNMNDYDWFIYAGYPPVPFSYTYSQDTTTSWDASFEAAWTFAYSRPFTVALYGTYRYQSLSHVENGAIGWQYVLDNKTNEYYTVGVNIPATTDALEYTLTSHTIGIGLVADLQAATSFTLELRAAYTPVYISDSDDHKLRTKLSTASGWGNGFYGDLRATYEFPPSGGFTPYVALDGEVIYYVVNTSQTQYWYGNADAANGAPQGTLLTGIGHVVTSNQYQIGVRVGLKF